MRPYLDQLGLDVSPDTPMAALSIAQQQLVEIAKALSLNARVLIMDEPTSSLTLAETARLHEVVADAAASGASPIIYITHRLGEVPAIADRAVVLRDGANAGALGRDELTHDNMIRLMVGRDISTTGAPRRRAIGRRASYFRVDGLRTRRYPQHAVSFAVGRGEILGIAGLVGAGRSEVARAIFGVEPRGRWHGRLDGAPLSHRPIPRTPSATACSSCRRIGGPPAWSSTSRFARTCRCRRSAATRARARLRSARARRRSPRSCRAAAGQGAVDRGRGPPRSAAATSRRSCWRSGSRSGRRC